MKPIWGYRTMQKTPLFILTLLIVLSAWSQRVMALRPPHDRVFRTIDFEERELGNPEDLPMHWIKVAGEGLPHYVKGKLSNDRARSGSYSFRFDLNGGSVIYRYDPKLIPVQRGAAYRVQCYCRTTPMPYARAQLTAYFVDIDGNLLPKTIVRSTPYTAASADDPWEKLGIDLSATNANAAFLVIELGLVQPSIYSPDNLGARSLYGQDIHGTAWFDDVTIAQVPHLVLQTPNAGNIFRAGERPQLLMSINDRYTGDLTMDLQLTSATGESVYQHSGDFDSTSSSHPSPSQSELVLQLPVLSPGWYQARVRVSSSDQEVGEETANIVQLADAGDPARADLRFGFDAVDIPSAGWAQLPKVMSYLSAGRIKLAVWSHEQDVQTQDPGAFDDLLEGLGPMGIVPTACLTGIPPAIARKIGSSDWDALLKADPAAWQPQLAYLISRHANHLDRWQIGADSSDIFVGNPKMRDVYSAMYGQFASLIESPDLAMPWPAWCELDKDLPATVALSIPPEVLPSQMPLYMEQLTSEATTRPTTRPHNLSLSLRLLDKSYGREARIRDVAQRMVYALVAGATRIDLPLPFELQRQNGVSLSQPEELFIIERTLMANLSGAAYRGKTPIAEGVDAYLFDQNGRGILAVWSPAVSASPRRLALNLGKNAMKIDLWGNATPLIVESGDAPVELDVGPMPFFIAGIDETSALMRASVGFDRTLVESSFQTHSRHIHFTNPSKNVLSGDLHLSAPKGWTIFPVSFQFNVNPGETFDREVSVDFPYNSFAGARTVNAGFFIDGNANENFTVPLTLILGLSDVGLQSLAIRDGNDLLVQQMITNYGDKSIDYGMFAMCPGKSRQEREITGLQPGKTAIKLYRFSNVNLPTGSKVRSGLRELEGVRILNDEIAIQ